MRRRHCEEHRAERERRGNPGSCGGDKGYLAQSRRERRDKPNPGEEVGPLKAANAASRRGAGDAVKDKKFVC